MKQDIYGLLNDIDIDLSELDREAFTEIEVKNTIKRFRKSMMKNKSYRKYAGVVAALIMGIGVLGSIPTFAMTNPVAYSVANFLGIQKNLDNYTTVINKGITKGDITVQLNEVILDEKELIVSKTIKFKEPIKEMRVHTMASIYVNGKNVSWGSGGGSKQIDDYTVEEVLHYKLEELYTGEIDMSLVISNILINGEVQKGHWKFEFTTSGEELAVQTKSQQMSQVFTLPNKTEITFTRYTVNDMGEKIYFTQSKPGADYDMELRGTDNLGNPVVFTFSNRRGTTGVLKLNDYFSNKAEDASSYTLELYAVKFPEESGQLSNDFEKIGEAFEIILE